MESLRKISWHESFTQNFSIVNVKARTLTAYEFNLSLGLIYTLYKSSSGVIELMESLRNISWHESFTQKCSIVNVNARTTIFNLFLT